ncbi:MAG: hypothetical protein AAF960_24440 [Bacteroidota bacterium]
MEETENFDRDWLNERYPFDVAARDKSLETKVLSDFRTKENLVLVDVGAGTGSNTLYFVEKLPQSQHWWLIEQNETLRDATFRRFKDFAAYHKYEFSKKKYTITIKTPSKVIKVTILNDSLFNLAQLVPIGKVDLVMANAVFDLFTKTQLENWVAILQDNQLPFYTTLTYQSMAFQPEDTFDTTFIDLYNQHMERPQELGRAMGKNAANYLVALLQKNQEVATAESTWHVESEDIKMHYYLLNFMENALAEMDLSVSMSENFERWVQRKKDSIMMRQQRLLIRHLDAYSPFYE